VAARDCDSWGCCNSSQQRFDKYWKESRFPWRRALLQRMTFFSVRYNCETSVYYHIARTCYGVNDWCGTGVFKVVSTRIKPLTRRSNNIQLVVCWSTAVYPYPIRITIPSQAFTDKERLFCTMVVVLECHILPTVIVPVALAQYIENGNTHRWSCHTSLEKGGSYHLGQAVVTTGNT